MTFLELCQRTRELAGITGVGPASVTGQTGEMLRIVHWVQSSWTDIQNLHRNWNFLHKDLSFVTVDGQGEYSLADMGASDLRMFDLGTLRCHETAKGYADTQFLTDMDFYALRDTYRFTSRTSGRPMRSAIDPKDKSLWLDSIPDATGYTITGRYWTKPVSLSANEDAPAMPEEYHMLIVYWALSKYAGLEAAPEAKQEALENKAPLLSALRNDQLPDMYLGDSM